MKKVTMLLSIAAAALINVSAYAAPQFTLNVNSSLTADDPMFKGLNQFRDEVNKRSGGRIEVKVFPSSQLGSDEDVLEQARAGAELEGIRSGKIADRHNWLVTI